ncbi:MAG: flagellar hook-basal body protein [Firmicutes bacterium]|nr:flagellar hook-basal body protein [Bacillota bacterium]
MAMMVALSSAVSGLKSEQTALDVIANNIANVNTTAYKSQTVTFSDILSQTLSSASAATATSGGVNAQQLGLGVSVASTDTDLTVGTASTTSNATDVALTGAGYFIVETGTDSEYAFSRAGNLSVDDSGNLNINGSNVCGWESSYTLNEDGTKVFNTDSAVEAINIYSDGNKLMEAEVTSYANFSEGSVLSSSSEVAAGATGLLAIGDTTDLDFDATSEITVYDAQGNAYDVTLDWKKCAVEGDITSWYWEASATDATISPSSGYVAFDSDGNMVISATTLSTTVSTTANTAGYTYSDIGVGTNVTAGTYTVTVAEDTSGAYTVTLSDGTTTYTNTSTATDGSATFTTSSGTITLAAPTAIAAGTTEFTLASTTNTFDRTATLTVTTPTTAGTADVTVAVDFSKITSTATDSDLSIDSDGYTSGTLDASSLSISSDGTITGTYSNGKTQSIAQIALAVFENANGLVKSGDNLYTTSVSSGDYSTVVAGTSGTGTMTSYALELSNVDLSAQFSSMMIAQRAYQANSKVISTSDEMLQALMSMKN